MPSCLNKFSATIVGGFEHFFYRYGKLVARNSWKVIAISLLATGLCSIGFIWFYSEVDPYKLWVPRGSDSVQDDKWLKENFPPDTRFNSILIAGDDILQPEVIQEMFRVHQNISDIKVNGRTWIDLCQKLPIVTLQADPVSCDDVNNNLVLECFETSILEVWGYDDPSVYDSLTRDKIINDLSQKPLISKVFKKPIDLEQYLNFTRDETSGKITGATATTMVWVEKVNTSSDTAESTGTGIPADADSLEFELAMKEVFDISRERIIALDSSNELYILIARAADDLAGEYIVGDLILMPVGFLLVFIYVMIMLGKFNCVETRALLALAGLCSIFLTIIVSFGLCSAFQLAFGPTHSVIPFIMLGIGIDDMFVIMQCFDNLRGEELKQENTEKIALAMKHAGMAITVTSLTDFIVFIVGASSSLPALSSFCAYCAVSIIAVYIFQSSFFVACLSLDLGRIDKHRNGCCFCYTHKNYIDRDLDKEPSEFLAQKVFESMAKFIVKPIPMVGIIAVTLTLLGVAAWGISMLIVLFEPIWFIPPDSYLTAFYYASDDYFPSDGELVTVYMTTLDYPKDTIKIENLTYSLQNSTDIVSSMSTWYPEYKEYVNNQGYNIPSEVLSDTVFNSVTSDFLFSQNGSKWQPNFNTEQPLTCGEPLSKILLSTFNFKHPNFNGPSERIPAMNAIKKMIDDQDFSENVFPMSAAYANWETDEVIQKELYRNLGVSMACIWVTTLILLADFQASIMVMLCVVITLVDVLGYMQFWGLTIDVVSSINVIIAIGLCVDYSAHIAHTFLTAQGSRKQRVIKTLHDIGPAVLNGGTSTFIALIVLAPSDSHVFLSFFRIFFLVIVFGLFHGLILLPVMLRLIGPPAYKHYELDSSGDMNSRGSTFNDHSKTNGVQNQ